MKVWDGATRLYHWAQAGLFLALMASGKSGNGPHVELGIALLVLVLWRLIWGFVGSETSRFSTFVYSPRQTWHYVTGKMKARLGHNPLGAWMVMALVASLLLQCLSGLALAGLLDGLPMAKIWLDDEVFALVESMHLMLAKVLPILVALHLVAILIYKLRGKPLVKAMVTGFSAANGFTTQLDTAQPDKALPNTTQPQIASQGFAFLMLVAAALVSMAIITVSI
ncbi:cytochrome b/b6 domain-containing protein [Vibrio parahaemolyticus]|uniref:cytochrome b/b6 domain-containing protein n=1 Tax=Vibrio parahaemolyticus TaxID=670 RepID=UPI000470F868|nr:cytochrome b/b6 domain-containing protein [Vibrio parahaemolyticus]EIZ9928854.1 cytochrome b/b6 domain-containing protein [Vibrio parahaemolyticus]MDF5075087.1 cytochrome b/b6 domain-containing protein [Vibrio parahaemolyticus]MDF5411784.1 cytochrome b/b6 domain-containing protein [Vibrio parahaemolyticus]MDF5422045.1 cytochrome b/b6 domain-containing protein [Vibrio parahaemolyticus]TOF24357.1 hydrogenase [Vibrio parahaemolyticus]